MDLEEVGINVGNWVDSAKDRDYWRALVNAVLNLRVPLAMELVHYFGLNAFTFFGLLVTLKTECERTETPGRVSDLRSVLLTFT